ncbi:MAG: hypothetical protein HYV28_02605 [Ignavibacteriales bacterium]|nr:hypothetical protein [Ignavibacteriales bacterium]
MDSDERIKLFKQIMWDYSILPEDVYAVLQGEKQLAGHYNRDTLFVKLLESYSWFTIVELLSVNIIKDLLTTQNINKLRSPSLREKYEFVRKRLHEIIPAAR